MTALGLLIGTVGVAMLWSGITGKNALDEFKAAVQGQALPSTPTRTITGKP